MSRRGLLLGAAAFAATTRVDAEPEYNPLAVVGGPYVYVGSYTPPGRGISVYNIDPSAAKLTLVDTVGPVPSPSFMAMDSRKRYLYAGNEASVSTVMAFKVNSPSGNLTFLNSQPAGGGGQPAHVMVHPNDQFVVLSNYTGSTLEVLPIMSDGSLGTPTQLINSVGDLGPNSGRQEAPHPHMALADSTGKYVFVNDLGLDGTFVYSFDTSAGKLALVSVAQATPGSGPRHLAWHPNGKILYSINELSNVLNVFSWDGNGNLTPVQMDLSTLPSGFQGVSACSEVKVHPNGKFLYAANRGHDTITLFSIDPVSSQLTLVGWTHTEGETPRYFGLDPTGMFLLVGHQTTNNIMSFQINQTTGQLTSMGQYAATGSPVCIVFGYPNS